MIAAAYKDYFMTPVELSHRRYEALRAVVVEEQPMKEVAERYEVSYGTVRNWVSEFRKTQDAGQSPPFSLHHCADAPQTANSTKTTRTSKWPTFESCRWKRGGG
jgi:transposase